MITVTALEAKNRFGKLLDRVARGEEVVVTRHDKPVARMVPAEGRRLSAVRQAVAELRQLQARIRAAYLLRSPSGPPPPRARPFLVFGRRSSSSMRRLASRGSTRRKRRCEGSSPSPAKDGLLRTAAKRARVRLL
jgi:prevent-host-death family protein